MKRASLDLNLNARMTRKQVFLDQMDEVVAKEAAKPEKTLLERTAYQLDATQTARSSVT